jgi:monoamine oxidase
LCTGFYLAAELLAKAANQDKLDQMVSMEDKQVLLESLREWGAREVRIIYIILNRNILAKS